MDGGCSSTSCHNEKKDKKKKKSLKDPSLTIERDKEEGAETGPYMPLEEFVSTVPGDPSNKKGG